MPHKLMSTPRQVRHLRIPRPGRKGNIKVTRDGWIECAKVMLVEEGIGGVRIDRLARRLKVTRGGFYYNFESLDELLRALLDHWRAHNRFTPLDEDIRTPEAAFATLNRLCDNLIHQRGFDPQFDMAVREWARISRAVADVVEAVDAERIGHLRDIFVGLGLPAREATFRAKVFYYHQIGYYALGEDEDERTRMKNLPGYLEVLFGERYTRLAVKR